MSGMKKVNLAAVGEDIDDVTDVMGPTVPMPEPYLLPESLQQDGSPDADWIYRMPDGGAYGVVVRWDARAGRKKIRPIIWNGEEYISSGFGPDRPPYNSDLMAATPTAPVLIVEGEKAVDGAQTYAPDGWIVTTWQGGANAWGHTDWSVLAGHVCVLWPDNDEAGRSAMTGLQNELSGLAVPTSMVTMNDNFPEKWDLGDPLPEKVTPAMVTKLLQRELKRAAVPEGAVPALKLVAGEDIDVDPDRNWKALGYDQQTYYIMSERRQQVDSFTAQALSTQSAILSIYPDRFYWGSQQGSVGDKPDWIIVGLDIMEKCHNAGVFDLRRSRGRGVWMDKAADGVERMVLNTGNKLVFSRPGGAMRETSPVRLKSRYIYERQSDLILDVDDYDTQMSDETGHMIREMCSLVRWGAPLHAELLAGWLAVAPVCGGLDWRPHLWVTGNHGSGKSEAIKRIVEPVLGPVALYALGSTTEAGIRSALSSSAIPIVFDESEGSSNAKDKTAETRRQAVLSLMRQSSSEGPGTIIKGSSNHGSHSFAVKSCFMLVSIGVGLKEAADLTRTSVLTIRPKASYPLDQQERLEEEWLRMQDISAMIPRDTPQQLLARQVANLHVLKANAKTFKQAVCDMTNSPRLGDQLGTLLAGARSLYSTELIDYKMARAYIERLDFSNYMTEKHAREDVSLIHHICGSMIKVETRHGPRDRTIGELVYQLLYNPYSDDVDIRECETTLARYGIRLPKGKMDMPGLCVATNVMNLNRIMEMSHYAEGWADVLLRHPYVKKLNKTMRFGGENSRALFIPKPEWPVTDGDD